MSLLRTTSVHDALDGLVHAARVAAVERDVPGAHARIVQAERTFAAHRAQEETHWLPLYTARCVPHPNATPTVLLRDHALIASLLAEAPTHGGLALVDLLEDLAGALEHHDQRERTHFKPALDAVLTPAERTRLLELHAASEQALDAPPSRVTTPWTPTPDAPVQAVRAGLLAGQPLPDTLEHVL
ncbi:MAG: hypothetical protein KC656_25850, partial [Myxococcales bacterium]|nr:hypothetical protein [Myxococcales bacterium]